MTQELTDQELIARVRDGQMAKEVALDTLFRRHNSNLVFHVDQKFRGDPDAAEDAAQMAWRILVRSFDQLPTNQRSVLAWLCKAAEREARRRRNLRAVPHGSDTYEVADVRPAGPEELTGRELDKEQDECLASLTPEQRELVRLKGELGLTHEQISERLLVHPNTVKNRLKQIQKILREVAQQRKVSR